ncbi:amidase [Rhodoferax sp. AJA081-3]|uniref:amidase n=1 Tax=Rhodoferax sp. AJA081-3 TaxID=2752316 RepID=UPI001AE000FE|nr:amidase [Rhodoferax sp. AJA081-3]QTN29833.1 amidase [Rhodoferax sp. AJA081-3]
MQRREFVELMALTTSATMATQSFAKTPGVPFDVAEKSVVELQAAMAAGRTTAQQLVRLYLARIAAVDKAGPKLNAVIELNPDALAIAKALDAERKAKGPRGPLHGMPVLLKDNIATADKMQTTAGSLALVGMKPPRDAALVTRLRDAGAVILGKTNLSEWANIRSTRSTSGWSARGGLTRNPYALDRNTSGSSSGSGASMAASLAAVAVGTETDGSITSPSSIAGLVGIKPTVGLVSRAGIIPISHSQDTAGPMARTVADAAVLLTAMAGSDGRDPASAPADQKKADYTRFLNKDGLKGKRIGVVRAQIASANDRVAAVVQAQLAVLTAQGATLVDVDDVPNSDKYGESELTVLLYELKADMAAYLEDYGPNAPIKTLADVIAFNEKHRTQEMPFFGQEHFIQAQAKGGLDSQEYRDALANNHRYARAEGLDQVLQQHRLDALVAPTGGPAWLTDLVNGDAPGGSFTSPAAVAGYPHITVPCGTVHGLPIGLSFVGGAWSEGPLIAMAYAYEQASLQRRPPTYVSSLNPKAASHR